MTHIHHKEKPGGGGGKTGLAETVGNVRLRLRNQSIHSNSNPLSIPNCRETQFHFHFQHQPLNSWKWKGFQIWKCQDCVCMWYVTLHIDSSIFLCKKPAMYKPSPPPPHTTAPHLNRSNTSYITNCKPLTSFSGNTVPFTCHIRGRI